MVAVVDMIVLTNSCQIQKFNNIYYPNIIWSLKSIKFPIKEKKKKKFYIHNINKIDNYTFI